MADGGILLALPTQSVAIRLVIGALTAFVVVRWLLHANLRSARVRVAAALVPVGVLVAILVTSLGDPRLPTVMLPADGTGPVLPVQLGNDYTYLAPAAVWVVVAAWALIASTRMAVRLARTARASRSARVDADAGHLPGHLATTIRRLALPFGVRTPDAALVACPGGAMAVGIRRPVLLLDEAFVSTLDSAEVEGVIAHELAHIARRDNLIALLFGLARDLTFFIPGGSWAVRRLLVERELAADQAAITHTRRPGALAAGLVKVIDLANGRRPQPCSPLMPAGTLESRVRELCDDRPAPGPARHTTEALVLVGTFVALVAMATLLPRAVAGEDPDEALGVYVAGRPAVADGLVPREGLEAPPAMAVATFLASTDQSTAAPSTDRPRRAAPRADADDGANLTAGMLRSCHRGDDCGLAEPAAATLELQPPTVLVPVDIDVRWRARQIAHSGDVRVFRLSSLD